MIEISNGPPKSLPGADRRLARLNERVTRAEAAGAVSDNVAGWQHAAVAEALASVRELRKLEAIPATERGQTARSVVAGANLLRNASFEDDLQRFGAAKPGGATPAGLELSRQVTTAVRDIHRQVTARVAKRLNAPDTAVAIKRAEQLTPRAAAALKAYAFAVADSPGDPARWEASRRDVEGSVGLQVAYSALAWEQVHATGGTKSADCGHACVEMDLAKEAAAVLGKVSRPANESITLDDHVGAWAEQVKDAHKDLGAARRALAKVNAQPGIELKRAGQALLGAAVGLHLASATDVNGLLTNWDAASPIARRMEQQQNQYTQLRSHYSRAWNSAPEAARRGAPAPAALKPQPWVLVPTR